MPDHNIVVVQKNGVLKELGVKKFLISDLYKKCGFRKSAGFELQTTWLTSVDDEEFIVDLWARESGKANQENKYDFPPPVDTNLYFGNCALVRRPENTTELDPSKVEYLSLTVKEWEKVYEALFGGFEDLDCDEESSEDELDAIPNSMKTKEGYLKDEFIASDTDVASSLNSDSSESELSEEEYCSDL